MFGVQASAAFHDYPSIKISKVHHTCMHFVKEEMLHVIHTQLISTHTYFFDTPPPPTSCRHQGQAQLKSLSEQDTQK